MTANQNGSFAGKVAFVTGAGSGIGRATALAFAREGASVVVADISEQKVRESARMIEEAGGRALAVACDVTRTEDVKAALGETIETFGRLDVAFNNAGVEQATAAAADIAEEEWDRIVAVNLRGVFLCMKYEVPLMLEQGGGAIVNTSSGAGVKGFPGGAAYVAAKHVFCAGQTSIDTDGRPVHPEDMRAQITQALDNLETVLREAGAELSDVVRLNYYTTDVDRFFEAYDAVITRLSSAGCSPASTLLGVARLAFPELLVEVEATAVA